MPHLLPIMYLSLISLSMIVALLPTTTQMPLFLSSSSELTPPTSPPTTTSNKRNCMKFADQGIHADCSLFLIPKPSTTQSFHQAYSSMGKSIRQSVPRTETIHSQMEYQWVNLPSLWIWFEHYHCKEYSGLHPHEEHPYWIWENINLHPLVEQSETLKPKSRTQQSSNAATDNDRADKSKIVITNLIVSPPKNTSPIRKQQRDKQPVLEDSFVIENSPVEKNFWMPSYDCESFLSNEGSNIVDNPEDKIYQIREDKFDPEYDYNWPNEDVNSSKGDHNANKNGVDNIVWSPEDLTEELTPPNDM